MRFKPLWIAAGGVAAMAAGIAIVHHSITGTWSMGWEDLLFWQRNRTYGDGIVSTLAFHNGQPSIAYGYTAGKSNHTTNQLRLATLVGSTWTIMYNADVLLGALGSTLGRIRSVAPVLRMVMLPLASSTMLPCASSSRI